MQGHDFACRFAGLLFASALGIGSAAASSISLEVGVNSPWSAGAAGVTYSSVTGLVITSDPGAYGSVFGSGALNLTSNLVRVQLNKPEIYGGFPHNGWSLSSASLSVGTIRADGGGFDTVSHSAAGFEDKVTFFNPNAFALPIYVVWNIDGNEFANVHYFGNTVVFGDAFLRFGGKQYDHLYLDWGGWSSEPQVILGYGYQVQIIAPYTLAPGLNDPKQLSMSIEHVCSPVGGEGYFCGYREKLRFDLRNTGVTFTSGSGVLLSAVVPEPATLGLMGAALAALMLLRRKRTRP